MSLAFLLRKKTVRSQRQVGY